MGRLDLIDDWIVFAREAGYSAHKLAKVCSVSNSHLRRHFQSICRRPPQEWLNELRLWHAMQLICDGMLIKQVAATLNFSGASHLCNRFKDYHGCAPGQCARIFHERQQKARQRGILTADMILPWQEAERRLASQLRPCVLAFSSIDLDDIAHKYA